MNKNNQKSEEALEIFESGFNCCQAVFSPFAHEKGIDEQTSLKITSGFGAGMCYRGETCGAVVGAHLAIGLNSGYHQSGDQEKKDQLIHLIKSFDNQFVNKYGSTLCALLLGNSPATDEGLNFLREHGIFREKCPNFVAESVKIVEKVLK